MPRTSPPAAAKLSEPIGMPDDLAVAREVGFDRVPRTELGRALLEARRQILASGQGFLSWEELEREIAERRGGAAPDDGP
jgi:hypothetical protein